MIPANTGTPPSQPWPIHFAVTPPTPGFAPIRSIASSPERYQTMQRAASYSGPTSVLNASPPRDIALASPIHLQRKRRDTGPHALTPPPPPMLRQPMRNSPPEADIGGFDFAAMQASIAHLVSEQKTHAEQINERLSAVTADHEAKVADLSTQVGTLQTRLQAANTEVATLKRQKTGWEKKEKAFLKKQAEWEAEQERFKKELADKAGRAAHEISRAQLLRNEIARLRAELSASQALNHDGLRAMLTPDAAATPQESYPFEAAFDTMDFEGLPTSSLGFFCSIEPADNNDDGHDDADQTIDPQTLRLIDGINQHASI